MHGQWIQQSACLYAYDRSIQQKEQELDDEWLRSYCPFSVVVTRPLNDVRSINVLLHFTFFPSSLMR